KRGRRISASAYSKTIAPTAGPINTHSGRNCIANTVALAVHSSDDVDRSLTKASAARMAIAQNSAALGSAAAVCDHRRCSGISAATAAAQAPARTFASAVVARNTTHTKSGAVRAFIANATPSCTPASRYATLRRYGYAYGSLL